MNKIKNLISKKLGAGSERAIFMNMATLATGTGIAKVLAIFTTPIITRIYTPDNFGVLSLYVALIGILTPFCTLKYSLALPLPKSDAIAVNLVFLIIFIISGFSVIIFLILALLGQPLLSFFSMGMLYPFWWVIPLSTLAIGFYELLNNWAIRKKAFGIIAKTKIWQQLLGSLIKIGLGYLGLKPLGLLLGQLIMQAGGIISLIKHSYISIILNLRYLTKKRLKLVMTQYIQFPKYRLPSQFLMVLSIRTPILFSPILFSINTTGQLGLALTMIALPMTLIGQTTGDAYYAEIARLGKDKRKEIYYITINIVKKLFIISFIPFLILLLFGPWLFSLFFGEQWLEAGVYARLLSVSLLAQFMYSPIGNGLFNVLEKQRVVLLLNILRVIVSSSAFILCYFLQLNPITTIFLYSITLSLYYIFSFIFVIKIIK